MASAGPAPKAVDYLKKQWAERAEALMGCLVFPLKKKTHTKPRCLANVGEVLSNLYDRISPGFARNIPQNLAGFVY